MPCSRHQSRKSCKIDSLFAGVVAHPLWASLSYWPRRHPETTSARHVYSSRGIFLYGVSSNFGDSVAHTAQQYLATTNAVTPRVTRVASPSDPRGFSSGILDARRINPFDPADYLLLIMLSSAEITLRWRVLGPALISAYSTHLRLHAMPWDCASLRMAFRDRRSTRAVPGAVRLIWLVR